ncbi:hypothetical protein FBY35_3690 [Streptomyces sp. SLBN-118]|uniref:DUF6415 family natural product biosynthesis protein n=1 Tax=Streptomyces sp. SLBN-118 TaxID=2768454 RepID=UPI001152728C|nr:DUF6415 family natural product biosynthesis protein [Streptomyces sp. SLBN-118]TQK42311.1 hypothetical protein FBY35_3690 [Streptomyces sp. SLBN-118]
MTVSVTEAPVIAVASVRRYSGDVGTRTRVLARLREVALQDSAEIPALDAVFDDLESVLGERAELTGDEVKLLTPCLHKVFRRILGMAEASNVGVAPDTIGRARELLVERFPGDFLPARAHLRRLAMAVEDVFDQLLEDMP